jgi:hypothetical protein
MTKIKLTGFRPIHEHDVGIAGIRQDAPCALAPLDTFGVPRTLALAVALQPQFEPTEAAPPLPQPQPQSPQPPFRMQLVHLQPAVISNQIHLD